MQDLTIMAADLDNMTGDLPAFLLFAGKTVACAARDLGEMMSLEDVAKSLPRNVHVIVAKSKLSRLPAPEEKCSLQFPGSAKWFNFFIDKFEYNDDGVGLDLSLRANQDNQPQ